jgi:lipopolysaccharide transport system permease protein
MYAYLAAMWKCRYFWLSLVRTDLRSRYRGSVLGIGWSLLQPLAMSAILCTVFRNIFEADIEEFGPLLMTGLTFWTFFTSSALQGCGCFFQGESYIRQYPAPMAIYPLRTMLGCAFHFTVGLVMVVILSSLLPWKDRQGWSFAMNLISLLPTLLLLPLFGWSVAVLFGLLNVRFRDTHHLAEVGLQALFYVSPVMYSPEMLLSRGRRLGMLLQYNPLTPFLQLIRQPIVYGHIPSLQTYGAASLIVFSLVGAAMLALRYDERRLIFHL